MQLTPSTTRLLSHVSPVVRAVLFAALIGTGLAGCGGAADDARSSVSAGSPSILVDVYHTRKQNPFDYELTRGNYSYQGVYGYARLFAQLRRTGFGVEPVWNHRLTRRQLQKHDLLFINLLDSNRPDFTEAERTAIREYVRNGGGLFVIADHTNVYHHAERLNPLVEPLGVRVPYQTAVDFPPEHSVSGNGWIRVDDFKEHPVASDLQNISLQTGAPLETEAGVAFTSEDSFGDNWDPDESEGFYGNWQYDGEDSGEPKGSLPVVAANEVEKGRVVVVGDQNIFGDAWIHVADNFELALNSIQWTTGYHGATPLREQPCPGFDVAVDFSHNNNRPGKPGAQDYFAFYSNFNRSKSINGHGYLRWRSDAQAHWLLDPEKTFETSEVRDLEQQLAEGKTVVLSFELDRMKEATYQLLKTLAPDFSVRIRDTPIDFGQPGNFDKLDGLTAPRVDAPLPLNSEPLDVDNLEIGSARTDPAPGPLDGPYLLDLQSSWGSSYVSAQQDDKQVTIARHKKIEQGQLIVFIQDGFWRNRTLGSDAVTAPDELADDAVKLQYRVLDNLQKRDVP